MNQAIDRIEGICRDSEEMSISSEWLNAEKFFTENAMKWAELDPANAFHEQRGKFDAMHQRFIKRFDAHKERKALISEREAICSRIEKLTGRTDSGAVEESESLSKKWYELALIPQEYLEILQIRFDKALKDFFRTKNYLEEEYEKNKNRLAELEDCCSKAETLAQEAQGSKGLAKALRELQSKWNSFTFDFPGTESFQKRFSIAVEDFTRKEAEFRQNTAALIAAEEEALSKICGELKDFVNSEDLRHALPRVKEIKAFLKQEEAKFPGKRRLFETCTSLISEFYTKIKAKFEEEDWARWEHYTYKIDLCLAVEALIGEKDFFIKSKRLAELRKEWKEIGSVPKEKSEEIWQRFNSVCDKIHEECKIFFAKLDTEREENYARKLPICEEIEKLAGSEDWEATAGKIIELRKQYSEIGATRREKENGLRERIKTVCDSFFEKRKEYYKEIHKIQAENRKVKLALCAEAAKLSELSIDQAFRKAKELRARWREASPASYRDEKKLWENFNSAIEKFFNDLEGDRIKNTESRKTICDEAQKLISEAGDLSHEHLTASAKGFKDKWNEITGYGVRDEERAVSDRFHSLISEIDRISREKLRNSQTLMRQNAEIRMQIIRKLENLAATGNDDAALLDSIKTEWNSTGPLSPEKKEKFEKYFESALAAVSNKNQDFFQKLKDKRTKNLSEKRKLCVELEKITGLSSDEEKQNDDASGGVSLDLLNELKFALETNVTLGKKKPDFKEAGERVKEIEAAWNKIDSLLSDDDESLTRRFMDTLNQFHSGNKRHRS